MDKGFAKFLAATVFLFAACSRPAPEKNPNHIVVWEQEDARVAPYMDEIFREFEERHKDKGVKITRTHYQTEDLRQQFQAASLAGVPPDLLVCPSDTAGIYAISGFIKPLNEYFDFSPYNEAAVESISLEGKTWGVPVSNGNHLMLFFNKKIVSAPPETTDELFALCESPEIKKRVQYCIAFDMGEPFWMMPWLSAFGGWPIEGRKPTLNTGAMRKAFNFYLDLKYEKKAVPPECDYNCMDSLFKEKKAAFIINGDWAISQYTEVFGGDFGMALIPILSQTGRRPAPMVSGKYFMVSSGVDEKKMELIRDLIEFYTSRENQVEQFRRLKRLPSLKVAAESPEIQGDPIAAVSLKQIKKGKPMPMATEMRAIWDLMRNYMGLATTKKMPIGKALEKLQKNVEQKIEEMNR